MSSKTDALPFAIGSTLYGGNATKLASDTTNGTLQGDEILGQVWEIEDIDFSSTATVKPRRTNILRKVMAVRNTSGITLHRTRLAVMSQVAGAAATKEIVGYSDTVNEPAAFPIDEHLSATTGCPNQDVCWVVIEGPALCSTSLGADATNVIAVGDIVAALTGSTTGAVTAGRVFTLTTAATTNTGDALLNRIGRAMSAKTTTNTAADILVNVLYHR